MACSDHIALGSQTALAALALLACSREATTPAGQGADPSEKQQSSSAVSAQPSRRRGGESVVGGPDAQGWSKVEQHDVGAVCLSADAPRDTQAFVASSVSGRGATQLVADKPSHAVFRGVCTNNCERNESVSCSVERQGSELVAKLDADFERTTKGPCNDHSTCRAVVCDVPALEAGNYTLRFAGNPLAFTVPGNVQPNCVNGANAR